MYKVFYAGKGKKGGSHMTRRTFKTKKAGMNYARKRGFHYFKVSRP
jgi:hypothetical protein